MIRDDVIEQVRRRLPLARRAIVPGLLSAVVHAGLFAIILVVTVSVTAPRPPERGEIAAVELAPEISGPAIETPKNPPPRNAPREAVSDARRFATATATENTQPVDAAAPALVRREPPPSGLGMTTGGPAPTAALSTPPTPAASFAGMRTAVPARRVVFVIDASGAMATSLTLVLDEVERSLRRLEPTQSFQVMLFGSVPGQDAVRTPPAMPADTLARATEKRVDRVESWLTGVTASGRSRPLDGLRAALALEPDLVFLLARSIQRSGPDSAWGIGKDATLAELDRLNPIDPATGRRPAVIKTLSFLDDDPTGLMQAIAVAHAGNTDGYRLVTLSDLGKEDRAVAAAPVSPELEVAIAQAAEQLRAAETEGARLAVIAGLPTETERQRVAAAAAAAATLLKDAPPASVLSADPRAPLIRGTAAVLLAASELDQQTAADIALTALGDLTPVRPVEPEAEAARRTMVAVARLLRGQKEEARTEAASVLDDAADFELSERAVFEAQLISTRAGADPVVVGIRPLLEACAQVSSADSSSATTRFDPLIALLDDAPAGTPPGAWRSAVRQRLSLALDRSGLDAADPALPSEVVLARAADLASDPDSVGQAAELLAALAARTEDPSLAADALWDAALLARSAGERADVGTADGEAGRLFTRMYERFPSDPRAQKAAALSVELAPTRGTRSAALERSLAAYPDHARSSVWRLELAADASDERALTLIAPIERRGPEGQAADRLESAILDRRIEQARRHEPSGLPNAELLRRAVTLDRRLGRETSPRRRLELAELVLDEDPAEALELLNMLAVQGAGADADRAALDAARAEIRLGRDLEGYQRLRELVDRLDARSEYTEAFWHAWTLIVETVMRLGEREDRAEARAHIERLRLIDPGLGGDTWRTRLERAVR